MMGVYNSNHHPINPHLIQTLINHIFPSTPIHIQLVTEGISTHVYRLTAPHETFYLRLLPEIEDSFAPEVAIHTTLRQIQVKVPEIIYFEHYNEALHCSIMITGEIKGIPVSQSHTLPKDKLQPILIEAGRDLARINSIAVEGFGWIKRDEPETIVLQAEQPTYRAFAMEYWENDLTYLAHSVLSNSEITALEQICTRHDPWLEIEQAFLAHGDFDTTHIYHNNGHYTGIIDFGEIRGANRLYDLGHFHMRDGEYLPHLLLPTLLSGYAEVTPLPSNYEQNIPFISILINVRALARSLQKRPMNQYTLHQLEVLREDIVRLHSSIEP
jgi:aminoglycoside phosphotransferase (APT) family kinase protein